MKSQCLCLSMVFLPTPASSCSRMSCSSLWGEGMAAVRATKCLTLGTGGAGPWPQSSSRNINSHLPFPPAASFRGTFYENECLSSLPNLFAINLTQFTCKFVFLQIYIWGVCVTVIFPSSPHCFGMLMSLSLTFTFSNMLPWTCLMLLLNIKLIP